MVLLERRYIETKSTWIRDWIETYMRESTCPTCDGSRLGESAMAVLVNNKNIYETEIYLSGKRKQWQLHLRWL